ncbi:DNA-directed DNA polymerase type II [Ralstonia phage RSP15]|uniref:DNA polymerase n=1 Tax=Ralstonia phage RSP15 TaxID=1785960 RepID=UPI00074D2D53|nr:DNA polymerase [Ralstonia phage RSP15]BAU39968.1 DNA-directed DNA polymerase type II [Ralstonia phage RSP15]
MSEKSFYTSVERRGSNILVRYITESGVHKKASIEFAPELYVYSNKDVVAKSVEDYPLARMEFESMKEASDFIERYREVEGMRVYGQKDFVFQFISRAYREMSYIPQFIRYGMLDIEVFSGSFDADGNPVAGPFPEPDEAKFPINAITVFDSKEEKFTTFGLEEFQGRHIGTYIHDPNDADVGKLNLEYRGFKTEKDLLTAFLAYWQDCNFDLYSGWNSEEFDTLYTFNRIKNVFSEKTAKELSPWKMISTRSIKTRYGEKEIVELTGLPCIDFMDLVKKHGYIEPDNWKLGTVANMIVNAKKIDYTEARNLNTLYITNYQKFIKYNIHDVNLVKMMNDKKKFIELTFTLAYLLRCNYKDTFATVKPWSASVYMRLSAKGIQPEIVGVTEGKDIIGGYVQEPVPGIYKWIASVDAASLYPHMMMQFNMGPETILPEDRANAIRAELVEEINQMLESENRKSMRDWLTRVRNSVAACGLMHEFYFDTDEFVEFKTLKKYNVCMSPNCALFRLDRPGLWAEICKEVYDGRKIVKKEMLRLEQILENLKSEGKGETQEAKDLESKISALDSEQMAYKIAMNSLYGAITNKYFVGMFDTRIGEGITSAGQVGIQYTGRCLNKYFNAAVGTQNYVYAHYNDTDSAILNLDPLIKKLFKGKEWEDIPKVIDFMDKLFESKVNPLMLEWCETLAKSYNCPVNKLIFKREKLGTAGIWVAKKRYCISVWDNEGVRFSKPKLKVTGLESVRSTYPKRVRDWLEECYELCLAGDESLLHQKVKEIESAYRNQSPQEFAKVISVNDMEKYQVGPNQYGKGAIKHVKASFHHNQMIDRLELNIPKIASGDKIMMVDLVKQNPLGYETMGFIDFLPEEFGVEKYIDKKKSFEGNFLEPMNNFCIALGWTPKPVAKVSGFFV